MLELSYFTLCTLVLTGFLLSAAVWVLGHFIRRRIRGPARVLMMCALIVLWYLTLWPLIASATSLHPDTRRAYEIGVHSIWVWWAWAIVSFARRVKVKSTRANVKTGMYHATGLHRIGTELKRIREKKKAEEAAARAKSETPAAPGNFNPDI